MNKAINCTICKIDKKLGLAFGWAIISKIDGEEYFDMQGDHIPEDAMLKAAAEFMQTSRTMKSMHHGDEVGKVVFAWPLTEDTIKAMGVESDKTGLMIAVKPTNKQVRADIESGKLKAFSIGGQRISDEIVRR